MPVIIAVAVAFAAIVAITRWQVKSAHALGKVSAVISATAAFAEAWSKTQVITTNLVANPMRMALPMVSPVAPSTSLVRREPEPEEDFLSENPSFRTGGIRGYNAYAHRP